MEKVIHSNIGGVAFKLDEEAYTILSNYFADIRKEFAGKPGAEEIGDDVEARVAELLVEMQESKDVTITAAMAKKVIAQIGTPEQMEPSDSENSEQEPSEGFRRYPKRLFRDKEHSVFGGVCSGLGVYFNSDPILFRVVFILLFLIPLFNHHFHLFGNGFALLSYIVLWAIVPVAKTHRQKMEMHGDAFNIHSVKSKVEEEFKEASESLRKRTGGGGFLNRLGSVLGEILLALAKILKVFFKIIFGIFAAVFIIVGVSLIVAMLAIMFFGPSDFITDGTMNCHFYIRDLASVFVGQSGFWGITIPGTLLILIPTIGLIYLGLRLAFRFKANDRAIGLSALVIWVAALAVGLVYGVSELNSFKHGEWVKTSQQFENAKPDTLFIASPDMANLPSFCNTRMDFDDNNVKIYSDGKNIMTLANLNIINGKNQPLSVSTDLYSRGVTTTMAKQNASSIDVSTSLSRDTLTIDPVLTFSKDKKWRNQKAIINLTIPEGTVIHFDSNLYSLLQQSNNSFNYVAGYMAGGYYRLTDDGLQNTDTKN